MRHTWTSMLVPIAVSRPSGQGNGCAKNVCYLKIIVVVLHSVSWDHLSLCYRVIGRAMTVLGSPHIAIHRSESHGSLIDKHLSIPIGHHLDYSECDRVRQSSLSEHLSLRSSEWYAFLPAANSLKS